MPHRPDTWTDALFIYPLYHVNFLTSFMEWFRFFFFNGVTVKTENTIKPSEVIFHIRLRAQEVIRGRVHRAETKLAMRSKPQDTVPLIMRQTGDAIETTRHSPFDNETIFVSL